MSTIFFMNKDRLYEYRSERLQAVSFGSGKKDSVYVPDMEPGQLTVTRKNDRFEGTSKAPLSFRQKELPLDAVVLVDRERMMALFLTEESQKKPCTIPLPYHCQLTVGRSTENNISIPVNYMSKHHFTIRRENGVVHIEDNGSTNGIFLNGKRVTKAQMKAGDVLSVFAIRFSLQKSELLVENAGEKIKISLPDESYALGGRADTAIARNGMIPYRRSPRTQHQLPQEDIVLAPPPAAGKYEKQRGLFTSVLGSGAMLATTIAAGAVSPALLAARSAGMLSPVAFAASRTQSEKNRKSNVEKYNRMRQEKYGLYMEEQKARIESVAEIQRSILTYENPAPEECIEMMDSLSRRIWERSAQDPDFLDARLGMSYMPLCVKVKSRSEQGFRMESDELEELAAEIIEQTRIVDNVPFCLPLRELQTASFIGNREKVVQQVRNLVVTLATSHSFEDLRIVGIFDKDEQPLWEFMRWLPHVWDGEKQSRYLSFEPADTKAVLETLLETLKARRAQARDNYREKKSPLPHYLFIIGTQEQTQQSELMQYLTSNDPVLGISTLFLFDSLYSLPHSCQYIVDVDEGPCAYRRTEVNNKVFYTPDAPLDEKKTDAFARKMSSLELLRVDSTAQIPNSVTFLEGLGVKRVEELDAIGRWASSRPYETLSAPVGIMNGGRVFALDIHEKAHGPHGLIAGTTGSGKSETLQSWLLSMCVNYHPYDVNFVIIDYKGGGLANQLSDLPHVVGTITNLDANIYRPLVALKSELKRREEIFNRYGDRLKAKNIYEYQRIYHQGIAKEPMPHLVIVTDEFAELKKEEPEFMATLVSTARVGRSLGVHMFLATQSPSGVVDEQINNNTRFRLCLKVQSETDSREMIGSPDAASLTRTGRSYVRVGNGEFLDVFQSFWSGASYLGEDAEEPRAETENLVRLVDASGARICLTEKRTPEHASDATEMMAVRDYLKDCAKLLGLPKLQGPWLPELPGEVTAEQLDAEQGFDGSDWNGTMPWLRIPVGMFDAPLQQRQGVQYIEPAAEGHYGIYGAPVTGKTNLLKTIAWSAAMHYRPSEVNMYILDFGGWNMNVLSALPHVGGVALDYEEEKLQKLRKLLLEELALRKKQFMRKGVGSLAEFRKTGEEVPAILLLIDNIVPLFDQYPDYENLLITLAREGAAYGIYILYTANTTVGVRFRVIQNIRGAIAFEMTDRSDYSGIVGRLEGITLSKVTGRAFIKQETPVEFQAAIPLAAESENLRTARMRQIAARMDNAWKGYRPKPIPVMPDMIDLDDLFSKRENHFVIPVGMEYENISPVSFDLSEKYCLLITCSANTEKNALLGAISQRVGNENTLLYVLDSPEGNQHNLKGIAAGYGCVDNGEMTGTMLSEIITHLNTRKRAQRKAQQEQAEAFSESGFLADYPLICIVIDDLKAFVDSVADADKISMERICKLAQGLGVMVLAATNATEVERYNQIESLTRCIVANQQALVLDGKPSMYSFLSNDLGYKEKDTKIDAGDALVYRQGHCEKVKLAEIGFF